MLSIINNEYLVNDFTYCRYLVRTSEVVELCRLQKPPISIVKLFYGICRILGIPRCDDFPPCVPFHSIHLNVNEMPLSALTGLGYNVLPG